MGVVQTAPRFSVSPAGQDVLSLARPTDLATAQFRNRVIHPDQYDDDEQARIAERAAAIPARTKRDWRRWDREAELTHGSGLIGLVPRFTRGARKRRIAAPALSLSGEVRSTHYATGMRKPKRRAYSQDPQETK